MTKPPRIIETNLPFTVASTEADMDYLLARLTGLGGAGPYFRAGFLGQQACEKYLKALSIQGQRSYLETHNLHRLADFCSDAYPFLREPSMIKAMDIFDVYDQLGRYGATSNYDPLAQKTSTFETRGVREFCESYIHDLDHFVFTVRSALDFSRTPGFNYLSALLCKDKNNYFVATTFSFRPPIRVILTRNNRYFPR